MNRTNTAAFPLLRGFELSLSVALALAVTGLVACSTTPAPVTSHADANPAMGDANRTDSTEIAANDPAAAHSDDQVTAAILAKLHKDPDAEVQSIDVSTEQGVVTLTGNVSSPQARNVAVGIVDDTLGVVSVHDELVVGSADDEDSSSEDSP